METKQYSIENASVRLTVCTHGAEAVSVLNKATGAEMLWQADPAVWGRHAPILFPYPGKLTGGKMIAKGREYAGGQHGFARDQEHVLVSQTADTLVFELSENETTLAMWPYAFLLRSTFRLEGKTVHHTLTVENRTEESLLFGIGYHPAFNMPFDDKHTTADYEFRFDQVESPLCLDTFPSGLLEGTCRYLVRNTDTIPLTDDLFDNDSHCMVNLKSHTIALVEKDTGRRITCDITDFPYTVIWSMPKKPLPFICIEPWQAVPGEKEGPLEWERRPASAKLKKGESWSTTLSTTFDR